MSPCALHVFFLDAIVMQTPMSHGKKHLRRGSNCETMQGEVVSKQHALVICK